jgi:hypothetical protein
MPGVPETDSCEKMSVRIKKQETGKRCCGSRKSLSQAESKPEENY